MKYKIAICKINMIGSPALILGFCRYDDDDSFWQKFQLFTMEEWLNCQYTFNPNSEWGFKSQEEADKASTQMRKAAQNLSKYHGNTIHFNSINKDVNVLKKIHDFNLTEAEQVELTKDEWKTLSEELNDDGWTDFDSETWGK